MTDLKVQQRAAQDAPPTTPPRTRAQLHQPKGRLDTLDGIRTIAVMLVVFYHVSVPGVTAGFIGVDVFFVLSGYLITTLLIREINGTGRIDLARFWARRVLRLMPASLLVIAVVVGWGVLAAPAYQRPSLGADALWSLLYVANWRFISSSSYFANDGTQSPLQHVWSLAVEEQFYLGWPLLLVLATAIFLRRMPPRHSPPSAGMPWSDARNVGQVEQDRIARLRQIAVVIGVLAGVQVILSAAALWLLYDPSAPDRAYMGTDAKAFEPLLGALAAAVVQTPRARRFARRYADALMLTGLLGILGGVLTLADSNGPKPAYFGGGALVFAILCALLIVGAAFTRDDYGIGRLLAWTPMAYLGRISYGIYLWHWPLAVWAGTHPQWKPAQAAAVVAGTIVLAATSHHFYERPIRTGRPARIPSWQVLGGGGLAISMLVASCGLLGGTPVSSIVPPLRPGSEEDTIVVVGDSVARRMMPALARQGAARGLTVLNAARGGCPSLGVNVVGDDGTLVNGVDCAAAVPSAQRETIEQARPSAVLWWSRYELADRQGPDGTVLKAGTSAFWQAQEVALKQTVDRLAATGATVLIVEVDRVGLGINARCTTASCPGFLRALRDNDTLRTTWNTLVREYAATDRRVAVVTIDDVFCRDADNPCDDRLPMRSAGPETTPPNATPSPTQPAQARLDPAASSRPLRAFAAPDGSGYARPDGSHFRDSVTASLADILLTRLESVVADPRNGVPATTGAAHIPK